ncbi:MAG: DEAD/DEAH box helicase [Prevotella sp.]
MQTKNSYYYISADAFFKDLADMCANETPIRDKYAVMRNVFRVLVDQKLVDNRLAFTGLFAKVDYLIKESRMPFDMARRINTTRKILFPTPKDKTTFTDRELTESFPHDLKAVCQFISALCDGAHVPMALRKLYPATDREIVWGRFDERLQRVIVESWDDSYITARADGADGVLRICYDTSNEYLLKGDWSYLHDIIRENTVLNIVSIRKIDDVCYPEVIVVEPDFLVDVSTIASCMETYADSPLVGLLNRLKPIRSTAPMLLGSLAGQFLDETVKGENKSYAESIKDFFSKNSVRMLAVDIPADFHNEARRQKENISRLIGEDLPAEVEGYDKEDVVLEPSFFCETLGIQGRMDFLQTGGSVIIEQKSGKGDFVPFTSPHYNPNVPKARESHYAQLMLYRALMRYGFNMRSDKLKNVFLLYSKYSKGLLRLGVSPDILYRAMRLRNEIARQEIDFAYNGMGVLTTLTADDLNEKGVSGKLWNEYVCPQIEELLQPVRNASPLEQAYYLRFLRFIAMEHLLSKIGNKTKEDSGFAAKWLNSLEEKKASGNIYDRMTIDRLVHNGDSVESVVLLFDGDVDTDMSNFRMGDIVVLYPYAVGRVPDVCAQMVFRGTLSDITPIGITVRLRNIQMGDKVFHKPDSVRWAVERDFFESSYNSLYSGMQAFLTASKRRRDLILTQREPETDTTKVLAGDYGAFNDLVLRAKQAREMFLVIGPPGTGKTSFGMLNIVREELASGDSCILLTAYTNYAVDEICSKLREAGIDFIRIGSELMCSPAYRDNLIENRTAQCKDLGAIKELIKNTRVFCGTTSSLNGSAALFSIKSFDIAVVDEASQILEPHLVGLMSAQCNGTEAIKKFVFIGDHKQLPAVVQQTADESAVTEPELLGINLTDCRLSLFERLLRKYKDDPRYVYMLTRQGRMHRDIAMFPNISFYENRLAVVPCPHQEVPLPLHVDCDNGISELLSTRRVVFLAAPSSPGHIDSDKVNRVEAEMIAATVVQAYRMRSVSFDVTSTIGVIVPYRNQIATVRKAIDNYGISVLHDITIDTVERFQGSQRDIIIYGFTIQRQYQLNFLVSNVFDDGGISIDRKLNVAMTRAREHLILIGNPQLLCIDKVFASLIKYARENNAYFDVSAADYCSGNFHVTD